MPPPPNRKEAKPPTNDAQLNELLLALRYTRVSYEKREMARPDELEKAHEDLNAATRRARAAARAFAYRPMTTAQSVSLELSDEQRRQTRRLQIDVHAEIQRRKDNPDAEPRPMPSLHDFGKAFGLEAEKDRSKKQEEAEQKGWMPKKYTPVRFQNGRECLDIWFSIA